MTAEHMVAIVELFNRLLVEIKERKQERLDRKKEEDHDDEEEERIEDEAQRDQEIIAHVCQCGVWWLCGCVVRVA